MEATAIPMDANQNRYDASHRFAQPYRVQAHDCCAADSSDDHVSLPRLQAAQLSSTCERSSCMTHLLK
ncbi:hypothetical protein IG631_16253 [Alternaria alternata]|nr:hypothetical protein IG631_16253 [Alternaria alternata]